jgi:hypothetical protein
MVMPPLLMLGGSGYITTVMLSHRAIALTPLPVSFKSEGRASEANFVASPRKALMNSELGIG